MCPVRFVYPRAPCFYPRAPSGFVRRNPYPDRDQTRNKIMPEVGQLLYPSTFNRAKHIYTEEEVRASDLIGAERLRAAG